MVNSLFDVTVKFARRVMVTVVGVTVLLIGLALVFLPGPAIIVIPVGLAILSLEFGWAKVWLRHIRRHLSKIGRNSRIRSKGYSD